MKRIRFQPDFEVINIPETYKIRRSGAAAEKIPHKYNFPVSLLFQQIDDLFMFRCGIIAQLKHIPQDDRFVFSRHRIKVYQGSLHALRIGIVGIKQ